MLSELYLYRLVDGVVEVRGVVLDAVPLELAATTPRLLEERRVAADGEELLHLVVEELVVLARRPALEEERLAAELLDLVGVVGRGRAPQRRRPVWKSKFTARSR